MSDHMGQHAVVVGAGIGGLATAAVLAERFDRVTVLDRDTLPEGKANRRGVPQGRHTHGLLNGGLAVLKELFPEFERDLVEHQAVRIQEGIDNLRESPFGIYFPRMDAGFYRFGLTRPLLEMLMRNRVRALPNVELCSGETVWRLVPDDAGETVVGVQVQGQSGDARILAADLVADCGGAGGDLTMRLLDAIGLPRPDEERIDVNVGYATAVVDMPDPAPDWKGLMILPSQDTRGAIVSPVEGGAQLMVAVTGVGNAAPPAERDALMEYARDMATPTLHQLLASTRFDGPIVSSRFKQNRRRYFERIERFPRGLVPVGDVVCLLNPALGQGMSVALQEAAALSRALSAGSGGRDALAGLADRYFAELPELLETPWTSVQLADASGDQRTPELEEAGQVIGVLTAMMLKDSEVLRLEAEIRNLLKPFRAIRDSGMWDRAVEVLRANRGLLDAHAGAVAP